jgi:hypothetical protein
MNLCPLLRKLLPGLLAIATCIGGSRWDQEEFDAAYERGCAEGTEAGCATGFEDGVACADFAQYSYPSGYLL